MALSGSLADFPLEGVLRLLESTRKTGVLEVSAAGEVARVELSEGALTAAHADGETGDGAVAAIFEMGGGAFAFRPSPVGDANLTGSLDDILARARALNDRRAAVRGTIPHDRIRFELSPRALSGGTISISPEHWKVLLNVDGHRDVLALAALLGETKLVTLERLNDLVNAGLIDAREPLATEPAAPPAPTPRATAFEPRPAPPAPPPAPAFEAPPPVIEAPPFVPPPAPHRQAPREPIMAQPPSPPVIEPPAPAPRFEAPPAPAAPSWPAPEPPAQPATDDLSKLLEQRLAALERPSTKTPPSPQDFWEQVQQQAQHPEPAPFTPPAPPAPPAPPSPTEDTDDRLAALFGSAPAPAAPSEPEAPPFVAPPEPETFAPPRPAAEEPVASHYLPPDTTAPILEVDAQEEAPKEEKKRGGLFGFGRKKEAPAPTTFGIPPSRSSAGQAATATSSSGRLASFANALIAEYNSGQYGKQRLDERMNVRLRLVDEQADPLDRMLPVADDRLDVGAIDRDFSAAQAGPYLAALVRQVFDDAERVFGKDKAKKGYKAAIKNALGGDESVLHEGGVGPILPKL